MSVDAMAVIVEADGGSRGNPGVAGYGAVVFDHTGELVLAERKEYIGTATNNVAEYRGLIAGLGAAAELGAERVTVRMDSKLVVEQMSGRWKVKHPDMIPLARQAQELAGRFTDIEFSWIPRAQNSHADRLANEAMDALGDTDTSTSTTQPSAAPAAAVTAGPGWTATVGAPTKLILLRHGQTALSVDRRYSGRGNPELTELGRDQARRAADRLATLGGIDAIVASPLGRAQETADAVAGRLGLPVHTHEGLTETDFGEWEGLTFREAIERDADLHKRWMGDISVAPPGGESFADVTTRVRAATGDVVSQYGPGTVLVVTHVTPIKTILRLALDAGPSLLFRLHLDLASLSIAEIYPDGGASVTLVNDTNHLL
ncbi:bifunctional RNase H/acid phosphatase [Williamsia maris]